MRWINGLRRLYYSRHHGESKVKGKGIKVGLGQVFSLL